MAVEEMLKKELKAKAKVRWKRFSGLEEEQI